MRNLRRYLTLITKRRIMRISNMRKVLKMLNVLNSQAFLASENNTHIQGDADWPAAPPIMKDHLATINQHKLKFGAEYKSAAKGSPLWNTLII